MIGYDIIAMIGYDILSPTIAMLGYVIGFRTLAEFGGRLPEKLLGLPHSLIPSLAFRHPPPNSARFSYATEGALFISAQLSTDANSKHWFTTSYLQPLP